MALEQWRKGKLPNPGPYLGEITNLLDPTYMGGVEVSLIKGMQSPIIDQSDTYIVRYLSPFAGNTSVRYEGTNSSDFNDVQKSYGMWMVPPDVGTIVMCIFIDGDPNQGYYFGCVQDQFQNHMTPGIAASRYTALTPQQKQKYGTDYLPVAEYHKSSQKLSDPNIGKIGKPVHPFADRLLAQGLLLDTVRGVTSSSARREVPSGVFGISTPGPLDPNGKKGKIGYEGNRQAPVSRLGGSTFVMDDGDVNGQNELVRIRTRTGHQILMHNSQDLIYIANSKGTAWIEMTSNGKLDIYAQDSVSIHTENDFNFRADRDINLEAGRNIHVRAGKNMETNIGGYNYLSVDEDQKISVRGQHDEIIGGTVKVSVVGSYNLNVAEDIKQSASATINLASEGNINLGTAASLNFGANGNILGSGANIHWNGPAAAAAASADTAEAPPALPLFSLPNRSTDAGWANGNFYKADSIRSIMQRVPTHEPWAQHENINPQQFSSAATDITLASRASSGIAPSPASAEGGAETPQTPANQQDVSPGTCDVKYAKDLNAASSQPGIAALKAACAELKITSPYAVATVLGVAGGESLWKTLTENFNYSASRLLQVFPSVFKGNADLAAQYAGNPNNTLPEFLYGSTTAKGKGLGNTQPGDGAKFIGRGYIQLTGRANYTKYSKMLFDKKLVDSATALVDNPELVNDAKIAAQVACLYFIDRVKVTQTDSNYFEAGYRAVGFCTPDIYAKKKGYYECFYGQLAGGLVGTGSGSLLVTSDGTPVKTGIPTK
jgi:putative chitinase